MLCGKCIGEVRYGVLCCCLILLDARGDVDVLVCGADGLYFGGVLVERGFDLGDAVQVIGGVLWEGAVLTCDAHRGWVVL